MENTRAFFDLCVNEKIEKDLYAFVQKCVEFGYKTIALDQVLDITHLEGPTESKKKNKRLPLTLDYIVPEPINIKLLLKRKNILDIDITILNRLTLICNNKESVHKVMKTKMFKMYHIFAITPKNYELYQFACDSLEVDIISFEPLDIKNYKITRKMYNKAVDRGIHFELMYYPAIVDQSLRRNIITRSHIYHQMGKSRNIIITSGCNSLLTFRGPYDIINMGLIFGLTEQQSKESISSAGANVVKHAIGRRIGKAMVFLTNVKCEDGDEEMEIESLDDSSEPTQKKLKSDDVILLNEN